MNTESFLYTTFIGVTLGIFLGGLLPINLVAELRRLKKNGVPDPWFVIFQRSIALLVPHCSGVAPLNGRRALVWWDVRWVAGGETMARITEADAKTNQLVLALDEPFKCCGVTLSEVRFEPGGSAPYGKREVRGKFLPALDKDLFAVASVVVFPEGTRADGKSCEAV